MTNFWSLLKKPVIGLSPMDGVTDCAMRFITKKYGAPAVMYTEFTNVEGVARGVTKLLRDFKYDESQRPIVAQIFGSNPEAFYITAKKVCELGFDGVDINMGCPAKNVAEHGAGAALIRTPELAGEIIEAVKKGVSEWAIENGKDPIPVSVKTRIGYDKPVTIEWIGHLLQFDLAAIALHGRTLKQLYQGKADWEEIGKAADLVTKSGRNTLILGNGDVSSIDEAELKIKKYGLDGILLGRIAMGNPWVFRRDEEVEKGEKMAVMLEHARKYKELFPGESFLPMRKHLAWYVRGFEGASDLRQKLVLTNSVDEVERVMADWL